MSAPQVGAVLFMAAVIFHIVGRVPKTRAIMFALSACCLGVGLLSHVMVRATDFLQNLVGRTTALVLGTATPLLLVLALCLFLYFQVERKASNPHKLTDPLMFLLPFLLTALGGSWAVFVDHVNSNTTSVVSQAVVWIQDTVRGGWSG